MSSDMKTDVVLVVKGAGVHKPDDALNFFLKGFIPAIKSLFPKAKVRQTNEKQVFEGFPVSPHTTEQHNHLTEIVVDADEQASMPLKKGQAPKKTIKRRIWVKEIYWENELIPSSPWKAFFTEWQMASYALRRDITNNLRKTFPQGGFPLFWTSFALIYFILGAFFLWSFRTSYDFSFYDNSSYWMAYFPELSNLSSQLWKALFLGIASFLLALYPALMANVIWNEKSTHWKLSGLQKWVMVLLAVSFLLFTEEYVAFLLIFVLPVLTMNLFRALLWQWRPFINSDFRVEKIKINAEREVPVSVPMLKIYYRIIVVVMLPILFFIILLAKFLKWTKILGTIGDSIEGFINLSLGGILGDVSTYAMDPAQAYRLRSVVENEIAFFRDTVDNIHIFAHSQGTPITFETLFTQLADADREKIKSYITIGSILSYYYEAAPILEENYPPTRFNLDEYPSFAPGFKWFNCWNLLDPITEFYGLDEFDKGDEYSPKNIKTRAFFHSDYWINIHQVHIPFINHILDRKGTGDFWEKNQADIKKPLPEKIYKFIIFGVFAVTLLAALIGFSWLAPNLDLSLTKYAGSLYALVLDTLAESNIQLPLFTNLKETNTYLALVDGWNYLVANISDVLINILIAYLVLQLGKCIWHWILVKTGD